MFVTDAVYAAQREYDVEMTSMQRHHVASTSVCRHYDVMCLLEKRFHETMFVLKGICITVGKY